MDKPQKGEVYAHYKKGGKYRVVDLAMHSNDEEWMVVYEPLYECKFKLFTRPLSEWNDEVEWEGKKLARFTKI